MSTALSPPLPHLTLGSLNTEEPGAEQPQYERTQGRGVVGRQQECEVDRGASSKGGRGCRKGAAPLDIKQVTAGQWLLSPRLP
jgi:hypothetical protein